MDLRDAGIYDIENLFTGKPTNAHDGATSGGSIINAKLKRTVNIPAYQRPYRWTDEYIDRLFQDYYDDNSGQYFLGSAVAVEKKQEEGTVQFDLVDGQQRITTLYLLNYVRFLINRYRMNYVAEKNPNTVKLGDYFNELKHSYVDLVGKNNISKIDSLGADIASLDEIDDPDERAQKLKTSVKKWLYIPETAENENETIAQIRAYMKMFLKDEQLCLTYSRKRYVDLLAKALTRVYLVGSQLSNNIELQGIENDDNDTEYEYYKPYIIAIDCIYRNIQKKAIEKGFKSDIELINNEIAVTNDLLQNFSVCIVVTENEDDAYKLFEVLNDRSLEMEDLELIKNHFYKEYCTKSNDSNEVVDANIEKLESIWVDKVFVTNNPLYLNRLISYFAAVYFTSNKDLDNKNNARFKNEINKYYSTHYNNSQPYTFNLIERDFNVYYAIKIILGEFNIQSMYADQIACEAEVKNDTSITYKTICLLSAMKQPAVMAGLINLILASYWKMNHKFDEDSFKKYISRIIHDSNNTIDEFAIIHKQSHILWSICIRAKDYKIPRLVAGKVIGEYGVNHYSGNIAELTVDQNDKINGDFKDWYNSYRYGYGSDLKVKILFLRLLSWARTEPQDSAYKAHSVKIVPSAVSYNLNGRAVQLDHLEPNKILPGSDKYFMKDKPDERNKIINQNVGNFMILDAKDNNSKKNNPLKYAIDHYYIKMKDSWLIKDICAMTNDEEYFDNHEGIPKLKFFTERTERLYKYFYRILNTDLHSTGEIIHF